MGNLKDVSRILVKLFLVCPHIAQERFLYSYSSARGYTGEYGAAGLYEFGTEHSIRIKRGELPLAST